MFGLLCWLLWITCIAYGHISAVIGLFPTDIIKVRQLVLNLQQDGIQVFVHVNRFCITVSCNLSVAFYPRNFPMVVNGSWSVCILVDLLSRCWLDPQHSMPRILLISLVVVFSPGKAAVWVTHVAKQKLFSHSSTNGGGGSSILITDLLTVLLQTLSGDGGWDGGSRVLGIK